MHFAISIISKFPFFGMVKLPMISELPIYLLSIFFPQYIIHPYSAGRMRVSNGGQVCGGVQIMLLGDGFGICIRSYLKFGTFDRHRQKWPNAKTETTFSHWHPPKMVELSHSRGYLSLWWPPVCLPIRASVKVRQSFPDTLFQAILDTICTSR